MLDAVDEEFRGRLSMVEFVAVRRGNGRDVFILLSEATAVADTSL